MHLPRLAPIFYLFLILLILTAGAYATDTWDATKDFGDFNPNGTWSYGYGTTGSSFTPYSLYDPNCYGYVGVNCWHATGFYQGISLVGFNTTGHYIDAPTNLIPPDTLEVHPYYGQDTIVRWTAPANGTYSIAGFFDILDVYPTGIIGLVYENGTQLYNGLLTGPPAQFPDKVGGREDFSFQALSLRAGDVISFAVNSDGDFDFDSTGFDATVTAVPELGGLLLLGSGLATTAGFARRRFKN